MSECKKLYNLIDKLNNKIKKLEISSNSNKEENKNINNSKTILYSYKIFLPKENYSKKKYICLMFDNNYNNFDLDYNNTEEKNLISFIKLLKSNIIINYSIQFEQNNKLVESNMNSIALGIKTKNDSKIKIIKGTKHIFDLSNSVLSNSEYKFIISNTFLYSAESDEELCLICDLNTDYNINHKKSIIKLLYV